jgi:hypothetical protein
MSFIASAGLLRCIGINGLWNHSFSPCGGCSAESFGIDDNGLATGSAGNAGFLYNGISASVIALPGDATGGGAFAKPNNSGRVPAFVSAGDGTTHSGTTHSFVYQTNGTFIPLPDYPGALATYAMQLGNDNDFVGFYSTNLVNYQGFLYSSGVFQSFSDPSRPDGTTFILGLNAAGTLVGFSEDSQGANTRGVLRPAGGSVEEFNVPGALESAPVGINDAGEIVGTYRDSTGWHGFIYNGSTFETLDVAGMATIITDINDLGTLLGYTSTESPDAGIFSPFLATPVPEPGTAVAGTVALLFVAAGAARLRRRLKASCRVAVRNAPSI